jgi:hypothetical protein
MMTTTTIPLEEPLGWQLPTYNFEDYKFQLADSDTCVEEVRTRGLWLFWEDVEKRKVGGVCIPITSNECTKLKSLLIRDMGLATSYKASY